MTTRSSGRRPSLWGGLVLSAATVVFCLLAGEIIVRIADPDASLWHWPYYAAKVSAPSAGETQYAYDPALGWTPIAGSSGTMLGKPMSFTAAGTRAHNLDRPPASGPLILALGDSMTEGFAVGDNETWPAQLERLSGQRVLNAAVRGYGLDQMVLRAERMIPQLKPSTVVLAFIADDILRTALSVRDAKGKPYFVPEGDDLTLRNVPVQMADRSALIVTARQFFGYSHLADLVVKRLGAQQFWYGREVATGGDPFIVSCRLMARFAAAVKREGANGLVVALPEEGVFFHAKAAAGQYQALTSQLDCAAKAGLATLNTWEAFQKENPARDIDTYYKLSHFTDRGGAIVAHSIAAALASNND